jgi:thymidylate synthase
MQWLGANYARDLYRVELRTLMIEGDQVSVRGTTTRELLNFCTEVWEPQHHCILIPSRQWNPWLALSESLWILAGRNDVAALKPFNSHIDDYSDDGVTLYGAYGARLASQVDDVIARLQADPSDRRAVMQIWDSLGARNDLWTKTKDPPCNNLLYFKVREKKLHMTVICRSNDLHFGLYAVNIPTFGMLQEYMAARLNVGLGYQTHVSNSLHVYTGDADPGPRASVITKRMLDDKAPLPPYPGHKLAFEPGLKVESHDEMKYMCSTVLDGKNPVTGFPSFLYFAADFLKQYKTRVWEPDKMRYATDYADWVAAGQMFVDQVWKK